jgi:hypothetical protein
MRDDTIGPEVLAIIMQGKAADSAMSMSLIDRLTEENNLLRAERDHYERIAYHHSQAEIHRAYAERLQDAGVFYPPREEAT